MKTNAVPSWRSAPFLCPRPSSPAAGGVPGNAVADGRRHRHREGRLRPLADRRRRSRGGRTPPRARPARLHELHRRRARRPPASRPRASRSPPTRSSRRSASSSTTQLRDQVDAAADLLPVDRGRGQGAGRQGHRRRGQEVVRPAEEAGVPEGRRLREVPQGLRARPRRTSSCASRLDAALEQDPRQGRRRARTRSPTPQIEDYYNKNKAQLRPARAARPAASS